MRILFGEPDHEPPMILSHPPVISRVHGPRSISEYAMAEYVLDVDATYKNPFDPADIAVDAFVTTPSGKRLDVPGFLYRPFRRTYGNATLPIAIPSIADVKAGRHAPTQNFDDAEVLVPTGKPSWRVRFAPTEPGSYQMTFAVRTRTGSFEKTCRLRSTKSSGGFVRISERDRRYFALDDGSSFWPLGENLAWAGHEGLKEYEKWIPDLARSGANWARFWLSPTWTTFGLVQNDASKIDLGNAWRLDQAMLLAQKYGIKVDLCIDSYNVLRDRVAWPEWERSAFNHLNGGPLAKPADFWTDPRAARLYCDRLRYVVARWGASSSTMAW
ncbi:MAG TPA: hypothetical protein VG944_13370, partial [Fimbriimonas sp.]|nr:hypothetical protein [Fimbriimonas sp.]